jgi:RNA polymerase sigma-70 factor (ECF subfamily)
VNKREPEWAAWMCAANGGDSAAYERLLRGIATAVRPIARRGLRRAGRATADAEDVVQDVLLAIHLKRHTWDASQPIGPWVYAIARYKLVDALRRAGSRQHVPIDAVADTLRADDDARAPFARDVERGLDRLPQGQRMVVRTIAVEGASISETAARLKMTPGAVRVALHRGLNALAKEFG